MLDKYYVLKDFWYYEVDRNIDNEQQKLSN